MDKVYVAKRDITIAGKQYRKGDVVTDLAQSEIDKRKAAGDVAEQPADTPPAT